eukprot:11207586-Lingulodinium_polyedra.AAC.1
MLCFCSHGLSISTSKRVREISNEHFWLQFIGVDWPRSIILASQEFVIGNCRKDARRGYRGTPGKNKDRRPQLPRPRPGAQLSVLPRPKARAKGNSKRRAFVVRIHIVVDKADGWHFVTMANNMCV